MLSEITGSLYGESEEDSARNSSRGALVTFRRDKVYMDAIERRHALAEGRQTIEDPDFTECDFIRIQYPGNKYTIYDQPVRHESVGTDFDSLSDPLKYPVQWAAYQNKDVTPLGTPLTVIHTLTSADVSHLNGMDIKTVEQLAGLHDGVVMSIGQGISRYRDLGRAYLMAQPKRVVDAAAQAEIEDLKRRLDEMVALMSHPRKSGRPAKEVENEHAVA
jgi:hypothetical protein